MTGSIYIPVTYELARLNCYINLRLFVREQHKYYNRLNFALLFHTECSGIEVNMNTDNKLSLPVQDIAFSPVGERELAIIEKHRNAILFQAFKKRAVISAAATVIVMVMEYIGRTNANRASSIPGAFIFIILAAVIFNLLSFGYVIVKRNMDIGRDHLSFVYGYVCEKYDNEIYDGDNHKSKRFILFETDKLLCTTAIAVATDSEFPAISAGDSILIVKSQPYGNEVYEAYANPKQV